MKPVIHDNWRADAGLGKMASPRPRRKAAIIDTGTTVTVAALALAAVIIMAGLVLFGLRGLGTRLKEPDERVVRGLDSIRDSVTSVTGASQATLVQVSQNLGDLRRSSEGLLLETRRLGELRDAFRLPGPRGGIGELMLENLLRDVLGPGQYELQHSFADGSRVDAVVRIGEKLVPIDSKFPMAEFGTLVEADSDEDRRRARRLFLRAIRNHVNAVAHYVKPDEHTVDFALMYIPAENVFQQLIIKERGEDEATAPSRYARERGVVPASPNTLYAYLQTVAMALRGFSIESHAREIAERIAGLTTDLTDVQRDLGVLGSHLANAQNKFDDVDRGLSGLERKLAISEESLGRDDD